VRTVLRAYDLFPAAFSGEDVESYVEDCTEDVELVPIMAALEGRVYRGHAGVREWLDDLRRDFDMFEPSPDSVEDLGGGHFLVLGHWNARARGSGVELRGQVASWLIHRREGRIDRLRTYTNREEALEAAERIRSAARES
jgi:ketosteroid isomerase-like protein